MGVSFFHGLLSKNTNNGLSLTGDFSPKKTIEKEKIMRIFVLCLCSAASAL